MCTKLIYGKAFKAFAVISIISSLSGCAQIKTKIEGHSFETSWSSDTYSHWHACIDAGYENIKKDKAEHTFTEIAILPTFEEQGYTLHTCETCGYQYKDNETGILTEHNYSSEWSSDEKNHWHACTDKGYEDLISDKAEHTPSKWIIDEEPTTFRQGKKHKQCTICGRRLVEETIDIILDEVDYDLNLIFTKLDSGNYSVRAASQSVEEIVIPSIYKGKPVTMIGKEAFSDCTSLTSITIPSSVTSIGNYAFENCSSLKTIIIPNSVTSIGNSSFYNCTSLAFINIPNSVTSLGACTFGYCESLTSITIPKSVTYIGVVAFNCCSSLKTINFEGTTAQWNAIRKGEGWTKETPTNMVINCFGDCLAFTLLDSGNYSVKAASKSVKEIVIPGTYNGNPVTMIEEDAFYNCSSLTSIEIPDSVTSIGWGAFNHCTSLTSITIPDSVTSIGKHAFYNCTSLTSINIPNSVTSLGQLAFSHCTSLTSIQIPNSVTSIGEYAFLHCSSLRTINFEGTIAQWNAISKDVGWNKETPTNMVVLCIGDLAFTQLDSGNYSVKAASKSVKEVVIPSTYKGKPVTMIEEDAFSDCTSLTSINIPNSVTSISNSAFYNCESLTSINIPNSVTSIGACVFGYCVSLTSINIPNSVTSIGEYAFYGCFSLTSILIPHNVTYIGDYAFYCCFYLKTINFEGTTAQWNAISKGIGWNDKTSTGMVINCVYDYLTFTQLDSGNYSVKAASKSVERVIIPSTYNGKPVTMIEEYAFYNCTSLTSITIPNNVTSIGEYAFGYCESITSITIPSSVTSINEGTFCHCYSLTSIEISNTVTSIGWAAFSHCTSLTSIAIPNSVTSISNSVFYNCTSLTSITIPNSVTSIGNYVFCCCYSLETINFDGTTAQWNAIRNGENYDGKTRIIHCTDGMVEYR